MVNVQQTLYAEIPDVSTHAKELVEQTPIAMLGAVYQSAAAQLGILEILPHTADISTQMNFAILHLAGSTPVAKL